MAGEIYPVPLLERLREVGEPDATVVAAVKKAMAGSPTGALPHAVACTAKKDPSLTTLLADVDGVEPDADRIALARDLFARYGTEIAGALLLVALPSAYATSWGSRVLRATHGLLDTDQIDRRIAGTASFLFSIMTVNPEQWSSSDPFGGDSRKVCIDLRVQHEAIRQVLVERVRREEDEGLQPRSLVPTREILGTHNIAPRGRATGPVPINQEDLLGMLLSFSITVFDVLAQYDITWSADEQEAYLHLWDVVGSMLGIGTPAVLRRVVPGCDERHPVGNDLDRGFFKPTRIGLRPTNINDARSLLRQLEQRQYPPTGPNRSSVRGSERLQLWKDEPTWDTEDRAGRLLIRSLLNEMVQAMPPYLRMLPISIMRQLNDDTVCTRLNLGGEGLVLGLLSQLPRRKTVIDHFTSITTPNPKTARVMRLMANEVTRRMTIRLMRTRNTTIPSLSYLADSLREHYD